MASINEVKEKLDTLRKQERANQSHITKLRDDLDVAADGGNTGEINAVQAEIAARLSMAESFTRRISKLQHELSASGRNTLKSENLNSVAVVKAEMEAAAKVAIDIDATLAQLVTQLEILHKHGDAARKEATDLVRQLPARGRDRMYLLLQAVSFQLCSTLQEEEASSFCCPKVSQTLSG